MVSIQATFAKAILPRMIDDPAALAEWREAIGYRARASTCAEGGGGRSVPLPLTARLTSVAKWRQSLGFSPAGRSG